MDEWTIVAADFKELTSAGLGLNSNGYDNLPSIMDLFLEYHIFRKIVDTDKQ